MSAAIVDDNSDPPQFIRELKCMAWYDEKVPAAVKSFQFKVETPSASDQTKTTEYRLEASSVHVYIDPVNDTHAIKWILYKSQLCWLFVARTYDIVVCCSDMPAKIYEMQGFCAGLPLDSIQMNACLQIDLDDYVQHALNSLQGIFALHPDLLQEVHLEDFEVVDSDTDYSVYNDDDTPESRLSDMHIA